jgi:hypothetical protein
VVALSEGLVLRPHAFWDSEFESFWEHEHLSLVGVLYCQLEVSATGRSLVQRSPIKYDVSECDGKPHRGDLGPLGLLNHEKK